MRTQKFLLIALLITGAAVRASAQAVDGIKAVVHDSVITFQEVDSYTAPIADTLSRQARSQEEYQRELAKALNVNLDQLIERQLILHDFQSSGYALPESIIDEVVEDRIKSRFGDRASLTKSLQARGTTYEKFRQQARDQFIIEAMRSKNIAQEIMISPQKIKNYYAQHQGKYQVEDQVKLRMIVLNKALGSDESQLRELANEILGRLKAGASFAEMASVYSQGSQRTQGGDWDWVERSVLRKELGDVAFTLKPGEMSDIIDTPEAIYIMRVEDKRPAHVRPLAEVQDEIEKTLQTEERARLEKQWLDRLKKKTFVRYF